MDTLFLITAMASMGGLGVLFSVGLAIANKQFYVEEDPKIAELTEVLPGANCGGCGVPGCAAFAEAVVSGHMDINGCPVASADDLEEMAAVMGVDAVSGERLIARIMCQGGNNETAKKGTYVGASSCTSAHMAGGGDKLCTYSCLGYGDCVRACPFDAMYMDDNGLPVIIDEKCTGCGNCVSPCPRDLVELHPESSKLFILCKNQDDAKYARSVCTKVCFSCNQCVKSAGDTNISLENNLAVIHYSNYGKDPFIPTEKCQTGSIVVAGKDSVYYDTNDSIPEEIKGKSEVASAS